MKKQLHVVPHGNRWAVRSSSKGTSVKNAPTQKAAVALAKELIREKAGEIVVHSRAGEIRRKITLIQNSIVSLTHASSGQFRDPIGYRKQKPATGQEHGVTDEEVALMNAVAIASARLLLQ